MKLIFQTEKCVKCLVGKVLSDDYLVIIESRNLIIVE